MPIANHDIITSVEEIWDSMLGTPIASTPVVTMPESPDRIACMVQITGRWVGSVMLVCRKDLAADLTRTMFAMDDEQPSSDDIHDAFGELANMVGGNIKTIVGDPSHLSLPTVIDGHNYHLNVTRSTCTHEVDFECLGERLQLRIFEQDDDNPSEARA
ncbi:MAG: chemotaxis protein CheX [Myxococcota bacterium]